MALRTLKENNVTILFEREAMDTADAYSEFILTTLAAIAQEESRSISANLHGAIRNGFRPEMSATRISTDTNSAKGSIQ